MLKRGGLFIGFFLILIFLGTVHAQTDIISELESEYPDEELQEEAGIGPDNFFYFLDKFFDRFGDDLKVREERIAEIREMIQQGKIQEALEALERYEALADKLEAAEIDPERRDEARRGAAAIRKTILELASEIPDEFRGEFVSAIEEKEEAIVTSVEISKKIKELCETLSKLDPLEYSRICQTGDEDPDWHKKLDKDLTEEQRQEAIKFGEIMSQCFRTSGQQCRCEEIPFKEFSEMCSIAAPLAVQCEIEGNEAACEELDNLEMPELPPHLQEIFDRLEGDISEAQFELHIPKECREAGATNPRECMRIMIQTHAPEECRDALIEADVQNEREAREICEAIMFDLYAPEECKERGITDHKECGILMFQLNAPQECLDAGLTGEHRSDHKKCEVIMRERGGKGFGPPALGIRCREIQNPEERLSCYDAALGGAQGAYIESRGEPFEGWPEPCQRAEALTRESCEQVMRQFSEQQRQEFEGFQESSKSFNVDDMRQRCEAEGGTLICEGDNCFCSFGEMPVPSTTPETATTPKTPEGTTTFHEGAITGGVISGGNIFIKYFYR